MRTIGTVALLLAAFGIVCAQDGNWIENGDFEAAEPVPWRDAIIDHEIVRSGEGALRVDSQDGEKTGAPYGEIAVDQEQPETIMAAMWLRLEADEQVGRIRGGVTFHVDYAGGTMLAWYGPFELRPELAGNWVYHEARIKPLAPIEAIRPSVYMQGIRGSIYVDDIYLGPVTDLPRVPRETHRVSVTGKSGRFTDWPRFELTRFEPTAHVFHFTDSDTTNLSIDAEIDVIRPAPIYLTSEWGSQYWTLYSPDRRELAEIYTDERIDLSSEGHHTLNIAMSGAHHEYAGELAPGGWVFITDRFKSFLIYGTDRAEGEPYLDPGTGNTYSYWDSVKLDPLSRALGAEGVIAAFSVADLSDYEFTATAIRLGDTVVITPMLVDAQLNEVPLHGLDLTVEVGDRRRPVDETIGPDGAPTGGYMMLAGALVESVRVTGDVLVATPDGMVREKLDLEVTLDPVEPVAPPAQLELISWGAGHYAVSPTAAEGPESMDRLVADVRAADISRLVVHGRGSRGDAYPSEVSLSEDPEFDRLAAAQAAGADHGVDIYAAYILGVAQAPDLQEHPDWAQIGADGEPEKWYCYNNPEVRAFHGRLVQEIGENYSMAGIALDYCRPGPGCHCDRCKALFEERYGRSLEGIEHYDPDWREFQRESITEWMREIRAALREANPGMKLAGYVWGRLAPDADRAGQDWPLWLQEDTFDWVCVGQYTPSTPMFRAQCHTLKTIAERDLGGDTSRIFPLIGSSYIQGAFPDYEMADAVIGRHLRAAGEEGLTGAGYFPTWSIRAHVDASAAHGVMR
ncbi:MAG: family 10 glycosylhydrolase [Armatimonadia bacterium]|nr:family 10 glycosylhydrolase [Armatimonadia bacterium]